jgi:hypothetical protein
MAEFQAKREQKEASSSKSSDNTGAMRPPPARVRRDVESLGWMTESTKMPKKQRVIDGVGAGSLVDLKAQLYRTQVGHSRLLLIFVVREVYPPLRYPLKCSRWCAFGLGEKGVEEESSTMDSFLVGRTRALH